MKLVEDEDDMDAIWRRVSQLGKDVYLVFQFLLDLVESTIIKILAIIHIIFFILAKQQWSLQNPYLILTRSLHNLTWSIPEYFGFLEILEKSFGIPTFKFLHLHTWVGMHLMI